MKFLAICFSVFTIGSTIALADTQVLDLGLDLNGCFNQPPGKLRETCLAQKSAQSASFNLSVSPPGDGSARYEIFDPTNLREPIASGEAGNALKIITSGSHEYIVRVRKVGFKVAEFKAKTEAKEGSYNLPLTTAPMGTNIDELVSNGKPQKIEVKKAYFKTSAESNSCVAQLSKARVDLQVATRMIEELKTLPGINDSTMKHLKEFLQDMKAYEQRTGRAGSAK